MGSVQSMASSSSSTVPSSERTRHFSSQTESEMESSKTRHWSQLDYPTTDSESSAERNFEDFALLKAHPEWGRFFTDFETLEVGERIGKGAQADIYEARLTRNGPFDLVVKVMKGDAPLKAFESQWPIGMLSARSKYELLFDLALITILGGTVLRDQRLRGRFAFVMYRRWGDLRYLIDRRMRQKRSTPGPFPIDEVIHLMLSIAEGLDTLHNKHDVLHRDLKASNVLVWGESGEDISLIATSNRLARIHSVVADFECSVGVLGTGFWRAPEILEQLKDRVPSSEVLFTPASDVYSYGMTCYEIVTGRFPYDGLGGKDTSISSSRVLQGRRPELPRELPEFVRNIITECWHSDPLERPTFSAICEALKLKRSLDPVSVVIVNKSQNSASVVEVAQWDNPQALTLLEVMQILIDFEVTDRSGGKVVNEESPANIREALRLVVMDWTAWISENQETSMNGKSTVQIYVIEVVVEWSASLLGVLCRLLVATNFRVISTGCNWTREGRLEYFIYVEGARMGTLLWELQHGMKYFPSSTQGRFKIIVHSRGHLHALKSMDFTLPCRSSNLRVHQRKEPGKGSCSTQVVVSFKDPWKLIRCFRLLADINYKIVGASVEYRGWYELLGRGNMIEDIDVRTLGEDELGKILRILDIAFERGFFKGNVELIVSGPSEELHDDLMRSLLIGGLFVTGGQLYREFGTGLPFPVGDLVLFVTEVPTGSR